MKRLIILLAMFLFAQGAFAADTVTLSFHIPDGQTQNFLDWYCKAHKIPDDDQDGQPDFTKVNWVKHEIIKFIEPTLKKGKKLTDIETEGIGELQDGWVTP